MKRVQFIGFLAAVLLCARMIVSACTVITGTVSEGNNFILCGNTTTKIQQKKFHVTFADGYNLDSNLLVANGPCACSQDPLVYATYQQDVYYYPGATTTRWTGWEDGWLATCVITEDSQSIDGCQNISAGYCHGTTDWATYTSTGCFSGYVALSSTCGRSQQFMNHCATYGDYEPDTCDCSGGCDPSLNCSPILIDTAGNGFALSDAANGVLFDLGGFGGTPGFAPVGHLGWTNANSDDGWLALDLDGNGVIDNGMELFGTATPQPGPVRNGFLALAQYDQPAKGGNGDGVVDRNDSVFSSLRLWIDSNHNGVSEPLELHTLVSMDIGKLQLDYKDSRKTDQYGNQFKWRAKLTDSRDAQVGRWAWDVIPVTAP